MTRNITLTALLLLAANFAFGQTTLTGEWELKEIVCYSNGDTIRQEPSSAPMGMTTSRPPTTITFDSLQTFQISQWCMKCPFIEWKGNYQIDDQQYLKFIEQRDKYLKKKQKSFTADFNGRLTFIGQETFQITDDKGCELTYLRTINKK